MVAQADFLAGGLLQHRRRCFGEVSQFSREELGRGAHSGWEYGEVDVGTKIRESKLGLQQKSVRVNLCA